MVIVVIPARMGSRRLPGKPLADLDGLPMIEHVRRRASRSASVERVLVATDDPRIAEVVRCHGGEAVLTGPASSGTHRVALAVGELDAPVVNVQGDMPLLDPAHVDAVAGLLDARAGIATLGARWPEGAPLDDPALVKVLDGPDFTRRSVPGALLHVGIYGFAPGALMRAVEAPRSRRCVDEDLEQLAWIDAGMRVVVGAVGRASPSVDTPGQLEALRARFERGDLPNP